MSISRDALTDAARSELKRSDHSTLDLLHLAVAACKVWPDSFGNAFGDGVAGKLDALIFAGRALGDEAAVDAVLDQTGAWVDGDDLVAKLRADLAPLLADAGGAGGADGAPGAAAPPAGAPPERRGEDRRQDPVGTPPSAGEGADRISIERRGGGPDRRAEDGANPGVSAPAQRTPELAETPAARPLSTTWSLPNSVSELAQVVAPGTTLVGDEAPLDALCATVRRRDDAIAVIAGAPGSGRTHLARALATRLGDATPVVLAKAEVLALNGRGGALKSVLSATKSVVLVLDDVDVLSVDGEDRDLLLTLAAAAREPGRRLVLVSSTAALARLKGLEPHLFVRPAAVPPELTQDELEDVVLGAAVDLHRHHGVDIDDTVVSRASAPPKDADERRHPGLAIWRLDGACAVAALHGKAAVEPADLGLDGAPETSAPDPVTLAAALEARVVGQQQAITPVARRLAITRAGLDLRPERPDGVFLFVGPTGVGKTELAKAIAAEVYGSPTRLIRLDMSEYAHDWAVARLTGPQPGYVGFTEPQSWLTTRVREQPECVVLLDEIEKAHPTVWNVFLQVFDAGRLTDARGQVADFGRSVIVMTSNLGARAASAPALGFGGGGRSGFDQQRIISTVRETMAPELVNRLDEIVVFAPLELDVVKGICRTELERLATALRARGRTLDVTDELVEQITRDGYDPAYGARNIHRAIERWLSGG